MPGHRAQGQAGASTLRAVDRSQAGRPTHPKARGPEAQGSWKAGAHGVLGVAVTRRIF